MVNAFIHALNAVLVFWLLRRMTGSLWRSAFVAALFALHPLRVESVAWVCERRDVLSAFFALLSLLFYAQYAQAKTTSGVSRARDRNYLLALLCFLLGLMSKPMVVTVPFLMLLLDYWPLGRLPLDGLGAALSPAAALWPRVREKIPFFLLSVVFSVVTVWGQRVLGAVPAFESLPVPVRLENALVSYGRYLAKLAWPAKLALQYPYVGRWPFSLVLISLLLLIGATAWAVRVRRKQPCVLMGWLWFLGALLPVIGLIQAGSQSMADRFTYLPSLGLFVILGWAVPDLLPRTAVARWVSGALAALVLVACAVRARDQLTTWQNSGTVFRQAIAVTQGNSFAHGCLGSYLVAQGQVDAGIEQFKAGLAIAPKEPGLLANLAAALADKKQQYAEAASLYEVSLRAEPNHADRRGKFAELLTRLGKTDQAIAQYRAMLQLQPSDADTHNKLGVALASQGKLEDAIAQFQNAVQLAPGLAYAHCNLGNALAVQHKYVEAVREYEEALRLDASYAYAHNNLAGALEALERLPEAERHYREALRLQPDYAEAHLNLGCLLARLERREEAAAELRTALRLKPDSVAAQQQLLKLGAKPAGQQPPPP
jgi:tetratricopeptide (TPR) repeat protein